MIDQCEILGKIQFKVAYIVLFTAQDVEFIACLINRLVAFTIQLQCACITVLNTMQKMPPTTSKRPPITKHSSRKAPTWGRWAPMLYVVNQEDM